MKYKAVFAYSFSDRNAGDFSLNIAAIDILVKNSYSVTVISRFLEGEVEFLSTKNYLESLFGESVKVVSSPLKLDRSANLASKLKSNLDGLLKCLGLIKNTQIERLVQDADLVVLCGGNVLRCGGFVDFMRLLALDYPLSLARKFKKDYVIFPQSTAEINFFGRWVLGKMINNSKATFIRENISFSKLKSLYPDANLVETLDLAFFLLDARKFKPSNHVKKIAFTIRGDTLGGLSEIPTHEKEEITKEIIKQVRNLKELGHDVSFIVQGAKADTLITNDISTNLLSENINIPVIEERDTFKLIDIYSDLDLLIGMRLHSIILAAVAGTPSYGFFRQEWGLKNPGILNQINLPYGFVDDGMKLDSIVELLNEKKSFQNKIMKIYEEEKLAFSSVLNPTFD